MIRFHKTLHAPFLQTTTISPIPTPKISANTTILSIVGIVSPLIHLYIACGVLNPKAACTSAIFILFFLMKVLIFSPVAFISTVTIVFSFPASGQLVPKSFHTLTAPYLWRESNVGIPSESCHTSGGSRTHISGNLSPEHIPILLQRYRSTGRSRTDTFGTTIRCSAIKLRRTSGMRDSNSHGIKPGNLLDPRLPVPAIPLKCTGGDSNSQACTGTAFLALRVFHSTTGACVRDKGFEPL